MASRNLKSPLAVSIALLAGALLFSGCGSSDEVASSPTPVDPAVTAPPAGSEDLAQFYSQQPQWQTYADAYNVEGLSDRIQTAQITVPLDYDNPGLGTTELTLYRQVAADEAQGSIVLNPGGPGGSGQDLVLEADFIFDPAVLDSRDIVSFDPRGIFRSNPIVCRTPEQLDVAVQQIPGSDAAVEAAVQTRQACAEQNAELLPHVDTTSVAKDMDVVRSVLGQPLLDYAGLSYGTKLGQRYLELFPDRAGRILLDGALEVNTPIEQLLRDQAAGFESAYALYLDDYVAKCQNGENECELGDNPEAVREEIRSIVESANTTPLPTADGRTVSGAGVTQMITYAQYNGSLWPMSQEALTAAAAGDGQPTLTLVDLFNQRGPDGSYTGNMLDAYYAVNGLDHPRSFTLDQVRQFESELTAISPLFGPALAWELWQLSDWPAQGDAQEVATTADYTGIPQVLIIGGANDPATPFSWAEDTNALLPGSTLVVWEGVGHTATTASNTCINDIVAAFMLEGILPPQGTVCPA